MAKTFRKPKPRNNRSNSRRPVARKPGRIKTGNKKAAKGTVTKVSKINFKLPEELIGQVVLLDQDEFYPIYLDLLSFNATRPTVFKVTNYAEYRKFREILGLGKYSSNHYLIDETFGWGVVDVSRFIKFIRESDPSAKIVGLTSMQADEILNPDDFDQIVVKARQQREQNLMAYLAEELEFEFVDDNSTPEYKGKEYMQKLKDSGDGYPPKIYRDDPNVKKSIIF